MNEFVWNLHKTHLLTITITHGRDESNNSHSYDLIKYEVIKKFCRLFHIMSDSYFP